MTPRKTEAPLEKPLLFLQKKRGKKNQRNIRLRTKSETEREREKKKKVKGDDEIMMMMNKKTKLEIFTFSSGQHIPGGSYSSFLLIQSDNFPTAKQKTELTILKI